jgi:sialic acid synthase SpsE
MPKSNVEVDQSGRMEMSGKTVIAVSDGFAVTVRVTARVKQQVRQALVERKVKSRMVMIRMFVGAILLAVQGHLGEIGSVTMDEEYTGYEQLIRSLWLERTRAMGFEFSKEDIMIARVGKQSPAHRAAIRVTRRQARADRVPSANELLKVC